MNKIVKLTIKQINDLNKQISSDNDFMTNVELCALIVEKINWIIENISKKSPYYKKSFIKQLEKIAEDKWKIVEMTYNVMIETN